MTTVEIEWTGVDGVRRRMRFEDRGAEGWSRVEMRKDGGEWEPTGHEIVSRVAFEADGEVSIDA
jgi:hypothetical protein